MDTLTHICGHDSKQLYLCVSIYLFNLSVCVPGYLPTYLRIYWEKEKRQRGREKEREFNHCVEHQSTKYYKSVQVEVVKKNYLVFMQQTMQNTMQL